MGRRGIKIAGHNIISPLGLTSQENLEAILDGRTELKTYDTLFGTKEPVCASLLNRNRQNFFQVSVKGDTCGNKYTFFEKLCISSISSSLKDTQINPSAADVLFILSTTKGNVEYLNADLEDERCFLHESAKKITAYFNNPNTPIVVSNACISGVCAQILAARELESGNFKTAIIVGCDVLSRFIVSGFQSFKAVSSAPCKPFDKERSGLNLGEAAGTIVLQVTAEINAGDWMYSAGSIHNDANHISGPSRIGEGAYRVLKDLLEEVEKEDIAFVNVHGTATAYNDEMESIALHRAALEDVPVSGLKGFFGHTLGAAGIIETILSLKAIDNGIILPTKGFESSGTSYSLDISAKARPTDKKSFIKILSGFGGTNAGVVYQKNGNDKNYCCGKYYADSSYDVLAECTLSPNLGKVDDYEISFESLNDLYRKEVGDYPKFFKMDNLSKLGFLAAELIFKGFKDLENENTAIILFNKNASLITDRLYQKTICEQDYFPSPALFVYTLPNIVTGEIAIRHKIQGETSFYVLGEEDEAIMERIISNSMKFSKTEWILTGWVEYENERDYYAKIKLIRKKEYKNNI